MSLGTYRPGNLPFPTGNMDAWGRQFASQVRSELHALSKVIAGIEAVSTVTKITQVSTGSGSGSTSGGGSAHEILSTTHSDSVVTTKLRGSLLVVNSSSLWAQLPVGASGYVLTSDGTDAEWTTPPGITHPQVMSRASLRP